MSRPALARWIIAILLLGSGWIWISRTPLDARDLAERQALPLVNHQAPAFALAALDGGEITLAGLEGKAVVLNFWATWCGPCQAEMPELEQVYRDHASEGLVVVGINQGEAEAIVSDFVQRFDLSFPVALDPQFQASQSYRTNSLPTTFFIDRRGVIRSVVIGQMNTAVVRQRLRSIFP